MKAGTHLNQRGGERERESQRESQSERDESTHANELLRSLFTVHHFRSEFALCLFHLSFFPSLFLSLSLSLSMSKMYIMKIARNLVGIFCLDDLVLGQLAERRIPLCAPGKELHFGHLGRLAAIGGLQELGFRLQFRA